MANGSLLKTPSGGNVFMEWVMQRTGNLVAFLHNLGMCIY